MKITLNPKIVLEKLRYLFSCTSAVVILFGSASSGKSFQIMFFSVLWAMRGQNILIARKELNQVRRSVWLEITKAITRHNLDRFFEIHLSQFTIISKIGGGAIVFTGVDDENKLKSITPPKAMAFDKVIMEEADAFTEDDFDQLRTRQRGRTKFTKQIILLFNPVSKKRMQWCWDRYFKPLKWDDETSTTLQGEIPLGEGDFETVTIHRAVYQDNKYLAKDDILKFKALKRDNPRKYRVFGEGRFGASGKTVFDVNKYWVSDFDIETLLSSGYQMRIGLDFGYVHNMAMTVSLLNKRTKKIYVIGLVYEKEMGKEQFAEKCLQLLDRLGYSKRAQVLCDYAEPESIVRMVNAGLKGARRCAPKNVTNQVDYLQTHDIIVHENCRPLYEEMEALNYKRVNGEYTEDLDDSYGDDAIASLRYAFSYDAKSNGSSFVGKKIRI